MNRYELAKEREREQLEILKNKKGFYEAELFLPRNHEMKKVEYKLFTEVQNERQWYHREFGTHGTLKEAVKEYIKLKENETIWLGDNSFIRRYVTIESKEWDEVSTHRDWTVNIDQLAK